MSGEAPYPAPSIALALRVGVARRKDWGFRSKKEKKRQRKTRKTSLKTDGTCQFTSSINISIVRLHAPKNSFSF